MVVADISGAKIVVLNTFWCHVLVSLSIEWVKRAWWTARDSGGRSQEGRALLQKKRYGAWLPTKHRVAGLGDTSGSSREIAAQISVDVPDYPPVRRMF